jgi:hypothetical protein
LELFSKRRATILRVYRFVEFAVPPCHCGSSEGDTPRSSTPPALSPPTARQAAVEQRYTDIAWLTVDLRVSASSPAAA